METCTDKRQLLELDSNLKLRIGALDGKCGITSASDVFTSHIGEDFGRWKIAKPLPKFTPEADLLVFKLLGIAKIETMLKNFDSRKIELTQAQIVELFRTYPELVAFNETAFLPFEEHGFKYVATVKHFNDGLFIFPKPRNDEEYLIGTLYNYKIIVPSEAIIM